MNSQSWALPWGEPGIHTHYLVCRNALWFNASLLYFCHILKRSRPGKKGNSLDCSWIVILQSSITASQMRLGSCFPNTVYIYILYTLPSLVFTVWNALQPPCPLLQSMANVVLKTPLVTFCSREQGGYWDILASFLECISICILYNESPNPSHITYALITLCSPKIALIAFASAGVTLYDEQYFICKQRRQILGMGRGRNWLSWVCYSTTL